MPEVKATRFMVKVYGVGGETRVHGASTWRELAHLGRVIAECATQSAIIEGETGPDHDPDLPCWTLES